MRPAAVAYQYAPPFAPRRHLHDREPGPEVHRAVRMVNQLRVAVAVHAVRNWNPTELLIAAGTVILIQYVPVTDAKYSSVCMFPLGLKVRCTNLYRNYAFLAVLPAVRY
jgi:hypothetical protein